MQDKTVPPEESSRKRVEALRSLVDGEYESLVGMRLSDFKPYAKGTNSELMNVEIAAVWSNTLKGTRA